MEEVANFIGVTPPTLYHWCNKSQIIGETLKDARDRAICQVENALFKLCLSGNTTAIVFYLKNRRPDKWKDRTETNNTNNNKLDIKLIIS